MRRKRDGIWKRAIAFIAPKFTVRNGVIAILTILLAGFMARDAFVQFVRGYNPRVALMVQPDDPIALTRLATLRAAANSDLSPNAADEARRSLRRLLLNPEATYILGSNDAASLRSGKPSELTLITERLSRRTAMNQLFMFDLALRRKDLSAALNMLDQLLRYRPAIGEQVFPTFTKALVTPEARNILLSHLLGAPWAGTFIDYAAEYGDPGSVGELLNMLPAKVLNEQNDVSIGKVIGKLIATGELDSALTLYEKTGGKLARNGNLVGSKDDFNQNFEPFTWQLFANEDVYSTSLGKRGGMVISISSNRRALAARRVLFLGRGEHQINWSMDAYGEDIELIPTVNCFRPGKQHLVLDGDKITGDSLEKSSAVIKIPNRCPVQYLNIELETQAIRTTPEVTLSSLTVN